MIDPRDQMQAEHDARLSEHPAFQAPVEMPGVEEIRRIIDDALNSAIPEPWEVSAHAATRILALFAPILAERERLAGMADAYAACESVARKRVDHIDPALEERLPALCEISRETWLAHKERAPIMAVDMLEHAKRKALEARALAAEAALAAERERCAKIAESPMHTLDWRARAAIAAAIRAQGE